MTGPNDDVREEFAEFVRSRSSALLRTAYLLTGDNSSAEDLLQDALAKSFVHWGRVAAAGAPDAYVRKVMLNDQRRSWRRLRRHADLPWPEDIEPEGTARYDDYDLLRRALLTLGVRQRQVLVLRYFDDLKDSDIASVLNSFGRRSPVAQVTGAV